MGLMDRHEPRRPWGMILTLLVVVLAFGLSLPLQVKTFQQTRPASPAEVNRNADLIRRLTGDVAVVCEQVNALALRAGVPPTPCATPTGAPR